MSANHYHILGVAPGADGAAIRSAYRALMRVYHPDRNPDPEAQSRAREITAAFAILGDPEKRAAYDASTFGMPIGEQPWLADARRAPAPMRKLGMACIAVALVLSVTLALRPERPPAPVSRSLAAASSKSNHAPALRQPDPSSAQDRGAARVPDAAKPVDVPPVIAVISRPAAPIPIPQQSKEPTPSLAKAQLAPPAMRDAPPPLPLPTEPMASAESKPVPDARRVQVERLATGFLKQSLEHADWKKQQLLLSARIRAATSRHLCRSDDCVTQTYLHQIRDTTTIMEGRIPSP